MTGFSRVLIAATFVVASAAAVSSANAVTVAKPAVAANSSNVVQVYDRYDRRYHRRYYRGRNVVRAPFTRVESGRRSVVDAPFAHVYSGRRGTHVVAPFVDLWR